MSASDPVYEARLAVLEGMRQRAGKSKAFVAKGRRQLEQFARSETERLEAAGQARERKGLQQKIRVGQEKERVLRGAELLTHQEEEAADIAAGRVSVKVAGHREPRFTYWKWVFGTIGVLVVLLLAWIYVVPAVQKLLAARRPPSVPPSEKKEEVPPPPPDTPLPPTDGGDVWGLLLPKPSEIPVNIKSAYGLYVAALGNGEVRADRETVGGGDTSAGAFMLEFMGPTFAATKDGGTRVRLYASGTATYLQIGVSRLPGQEDGQMVRADPEGAAASFVLYTFGGAKCALLAESTGSLVTFEGPSGNYAVRQLAATQTQPPVLAVGQLLAPGTVIELVAPPGGPETCAAVHTRPFGDDAEAQVFQPGRLSSVVPEKYIRFGLPGDRWAFVTADDMLSNDPDQSAAAEEDASVFVVEVLDDLLHPDQVHKTGARVALRNVMSQKYLQALPATGTIDARALRRVDDDEASATTFILTGWGSSANPLFALQSARLQRYVEFRPRDNNYAITLGTVAGDAAPTLQQLFHAAEVAVQQ